MKALSIDSTQQAVKEIDIDMQPNTVYSFFNSILIDELSTISKHMIYSDANALSQKKKAFFLGGQLIIGDVLITGHSSFQDSDVTIPFKELQTLISYDVNPFYSQALELLSSSDINLYRTFEVAKKDEKIQLNTEWVLYTFNIADDKTKDYFTNELKEVLNSKGDVEAYIKKMAELALKYAS